MKILHIDKYFPPYGGVGTYVRLLTELQRRRGYQTDQVGCVGDPNDDTMPLFRDFNAARNPMDFLRMVHNNQAAEKLDAFVRDKKFDVAHLHNIYHHLTPSILPVLARRRIGIVMSMHDYRLACPTKHFLRSDGLCTRCLPNKFYHAAAGKCASLGGMALAAESFIQRFARRYIRWVDVFICATQFMRDILISLGVPKSKLVVVPYLISISPPPSLPTQRRVERQVMFFGRLSPEKAPELMLDVARDVPRAKVVIAGGGSMLEQIRQQVRQDKFTKLTNVEVTGHLEDKELARYLAASPIVVITSRCMENCPMVMLEAMAGGACVIVPDHPPLTEWVRDGVTGRVFASGNGQSLAGVVAEVLADQAAAKRMGQAAGEFIAAHHNTESIMDRTDQLYTEAIRRCALRW